MTMIIAEVCTSEVSEGQLEVPQQRQPGGEGVQGHQEQVGDDYGDVGGDDNDCTNKTTWQGRGLGTPGAGWSSFRPSAVLPNFETFYIHMLQTISEDQVPFQT